MSECRAGPPRPFSARDTMTRPRRGRISGGGPAAARAALALLALLGAGVAASAADFLPAVSLHLEAARYLPAETDMHWTGTMGGGADLFAAGPFRGYIVGQVETIIGNTRRAFDATQANYTLEFGGRWRRGGVEVEPFFHHVSRHLVDRSKVPAVDWNVLGARVETTAAHGKARLGGGVGHTTLASLVGYRWELTGHGLLDLARLGAAVFYAAGRARFVTVDPDPALVRGDFLDWAIEGGLRFRRGPRVLDVFAAHERRHDVFLLTPGARDRALVGLRIDLAEER